MKKILVLIFIVFSTTIFCSSVKKLETDDLKLILSSQNMKEEKDEKIDINKASKIDMLGRKIASNYVDKIVEYREITGGFEKLEELKRIKGIREATYKKLVQLFKVGSKAQKKPLYINSADDETLKYYGFNQKEIKEIRKYTQKNGRIADNIELKKVINKTMYEKLKDNIRYEEKRNWWEDWLEEQVRMQDFL